MTEDAGRPSGEVAQRATTLLLIAVVGVAVIGYVVGIDHGVPRPDSLPSRLATEARVTGVASGVPAMSYVELRDAGLGPTRNRTYSVDDLGRPSADLLAEVTLDPEAKRRSLETRSRRRAFNGAPPVIPHTMGRLGNESCLVCHGEGFRLENRTARQMPHPHLSNCVQCHAPDAPSIFEPSMLSANSFVGMAAPFEGTRAWAGAPPVIPHTTLMRNNCLACHGPSGWPGMETTHPWRQNCLQCHATSSGLDPSPGPARRAEFLAPPLVGDE